MKRTKPNHHEENRTIFEAEGPSTRYTQPQSQVFLPTLFINQTKSQKRPKRQKLAKD
ncbi:hypothetical protein M378DRAFT_154650 [Amanita muscaria Koide BX008]|uniref:Uncharacterized protein n=1 Tax=Amanita muscaria (strain Koide BX008) TaxID=946122 RepID=A0A0C2XNK9_AMAMK|nr:hypothetical protein M378DRAFT_154650 [Amanita muscaria Koide BX008]